MSLYNHLFVESQSVPRMASSQIHHFSVLPQAHLSQQPPHPQQQHITTQDPKKRHTCPTCSRAFTTSGHLARHIRVHTGERNHKCPFPGCETRCSRQDNLQQHYRIHLSPGSRRASSSRRTERKKSSLSTTTTPDTTPSPATSASTTSSTLDSSSHLASPPNSPPPLARATVLPGTSFPPAAAAATSTPSASFASASASGSTSSASSPRASPSASPFMNVLGLSHERTHSPATSFFVGSQNSTYYPPYPTPSPSATTLPPIHSLQTGFNASTDLGLARVPVPQQVLPQPQPSHHQHQQQQQHPGPYPSYTSAPAQVNSWVHQRDTIPVASYPSQQSNAGWWNGFTPTSTFPVSRGYAQGYAS